MTLVCLTYFNANFLAISDSRVSWDRGGKLDSFVKIFSHRYSFTCGGGSDSIEYAGDIGLAFSGSTLFSLAFSSVFSRSISEMHSSKVQLAPTFDGIKRIAEHCAGVISKYVLAKEQCFEVLIFGFDPRALAPKIIRISLGPGPDGVVVSSKITDAIDDKVELIGSGARYLPDDLPRPSSVPLSIYVSAVIASAVDPATGGSVDAMQLSNAGSRFLGTVKDSEGFTGANYCGVTKEELGDVDGFCIGRSSVIYLDPFGAVRQLAGENSRRTKENLFDDRLSAANVAPIMSFLLAVHRGGYTGLLDESYRFDKSPLVHGSYYFSKICQSCSRDSPSIMSPGKGERLRGKIDGPGRVVTSCQFCGKVVVFFSKDFQREILWEARSGGDFS